MRIEYGLKDFNEKTAPSAVTVGVFDGVHTGHKKIIAQLLKTAKEFSDIGFKIRSTEGTCKFFTDNGIECEHILKMHQGRPNIADAIKNGEIQLVINTPIGKMSQHDDSYIRKAAIEYKIPYITTATAAAASAKGIAARQKCETDVKSLQEYHAGIS